MPLELAFRSSGMAAARKLCSFIVKLYMMKKPAWSKTFNLSSVMSTKDKYTWYVPEIAIGRDTKPEEVEVAKMWINTIQSAKKIKITEEEQIVSPKQDEVVHETSSDPGQF